MNRLIGFVFAVALVFTGAPVVRADHHETSTLDEFKEFGDLVSGRWIVDVTLIADWPGLKERKGEKFTGYEEYHWALDGRIIECKGYGGTGITKETFAYDKTSKKIKFYWFTSGGLVSQGVVWKKSDGVFGWKNTDGDVSGGGEHRFSNDGKNMSLVSDDLKLDGKELDALNDIYTKVSP